ncbi:SDR family oxidoreductase, partial [Pantoea endophytica]
MAQSLKNKIAVITGAASGIGLACTEALIAEGVTVVMVDRDLQALQRIKEIHQDSVIPHVTDLLDPESCAQMIPGILKKTGRIDILHAKAGCYIGG